MTAQVHSISRITAPDERHVVRVVRISPQIARDWLDNYAFQFQRKLNSTHVGFLSRTINDGNFDDGETIRCVATRDAWENDGAFYLVNGQHRLHAIIRSGAAQDMIVITTIVDSFDDVSRIYARIDRGRNRSIAD